MSFSGRQSIREKTGRDVGPVHVIELCQPQIAGELLANPPDRKVSVMMPCAVSVYQDAQGQTRVASMNIGLMGPMFGGNIARAMGRVAEDDRKILAF